MSGNITELQVKAPKLAQTAETKLDVFILEMWEVSIRNA
jgi:hypothetical protein